jgi:L,D-transpeptidase YcbB
MGTFVVVTGKSAQSLTTKSKCWVQRISQLLFLVFLMVILTGHEASNPKVGNSLVDFYLEDISLQIHSQSSILLVNVGSDTSGYIEDYVNILTARLYEKRDYKPIWTYNFNTTLFFDDLVSFIDSLDYFGIPPKLLNSIALLELKEKLESFKDDEKLIHRIALEMHATRTFFKSLIYLKSGLFEYDTSETSANYINQLPDLAEPYISSHNLHGLFKESQPKLMPYTKLIEAIPDFISTRRAVFSIGTDSLERNDNLLAKAFFYTSVLKTNSFDSVCTKEKSIIKFQKVSGLTPGEKFDSITYSKLKSAIDDRFDLICLNLNRLRKFGQCDENYLFVNIPSFKLWVVKAKKNTGFFNVVVGKRTSPTPVLSSKIYKIVANPFWTVPKSITLNEMLNKIRKDSTYLQRNGYMVINNQEKQVNATDIDWSESDPLGNQYWIRQKNGRRNALGRIKFLFPNTYRVYIHDTPGKSLFQKDYRAYSHGCVRVEKPELLAQYIIDNYASQNGDTINIKSLINTKERNVIELQVKIPIHIQYLTCMGNEEGILEFYKDIYRQDEEQLKELFDNRANI